MLVRTTQSGGRCSGCESRLVWSDAMPFLAVGEQSDVPWAGNTWKELDYQHHCSSVLENGNQLLVCWVNISGDLYWRIIY